MRMTLVRLSGVSFKESSTSFGSSICIVGITIFLLFPKVRMTWIAPLSLDERRQGIAHAIVPQSRGACTLGGVAATGRSPTPALGGWQCALPAAPRCLFHKYTTSSQEFFLGAPRSSVASGAGLEPGDPRGKH